MLQNNQSAEVQRGRITRSVRAALGGLLTLMQRYCLSRCDNLPNTAIESLFLGVPVIGTRGASIDELVEPGYSGDVVAIGDAKALAEVLIRVWRRTVPWINSGFRRPAILRELDPAVAASNLIRLAGLEAGQERGLDRSGLAFPER